MDKLIEKAAVKLEEDLPVVIWDVPASQPKIAILREGIRSNLNDFRKAVLLEAREKMLARTNLAPSEIEWINYVFVKLMEDTDGQG